MKQLERALSKIEGYLLSLKRDAVEGYYYLEVGVPKNWAYKANDNVECDVLQSTEHGDLIKIYPKKESVVVDDLIEFVNIIIDTNKKIVDMQKQLDEHLEKQAEQLKEYTKEFMDKIEEMKETSFEEMEKKQKKVGEKKKPTKTKTSDDILEEAQDLRKDVEDKIST